MVDGAVGFWCKEGRHTTCRHTLSDPDDLPSGQGSDEDPSPTVSGLCTCPCHTDCPMFGRATDEGWPDACDCPATLRYERRIGRTSAGVDFGAAWKRTRETSARRRKAKETLAERGRGQDPVELARLVEVIWAEQGLRVPTQVETQLLVEGVLHPPSAVDRLRTTADVVEGMAKLVGGIVRLVKDADEDPPAGSGEHSDEYEMEAGEGTVEVVLDPGAGPVLAAQREELGFSSRTLTSFRVVLVPSEDGRVEVRERGTRSIPGRRLGVLGPEDIGRYRPSLDAAARVGQVATCQAARLSVAGGTKLLLKLPLHRPA